jgi:exodeoxyribonuclease V alpha subunit
VTSSLDELFSAGAISTLDVHFAKALGRLVSENRDEVLVGAAMASRAVRQGHVCADLERLHDGPLVSPDEGAALPHLELPLASEFRALLAESDLVGSGVEDEPPRPLVLVESRLYLHRYFRYERALIESLRARATTLPAVDEPVLRASIARLFGEASAGEGAKPRLAAVMVALRGFAVVSGGPGTGKTHTVTKVLALLQEQARARGREFFRILLLAPTGKAAQRLGESVQKNVLGLDCDASVKAAIPREASTLHRALGFQPHTPTKFRHDAANPLPADLVLVDEASMVDIALMAKFVAAVPRDARLVLVGDKDQLASVEAGAILGDIYGNAEDTGDGYSAAFANTVERVTGLRLRRSERVETGIQDCRIHLTVSRRYAPDSGIALLAGAVNSGDAKTALETFRTHDDVTLRPLDDGEALEGALGPALLGAFREITRLDPEGRLALLDRFRILCAHRKGRFGVVAVNSFVERYLQDHGSLVEREEWYDGRPLIITENDYQLDLFNGDIGVICRNGSTGKGGTVEACFPGQEGGPVRRLPPARLPPHETVFAMTVHKSQGSEFDRVALLLPETESRLLTRELLYTGITRAKLRVDVFGSEAVFVGGIGRRIQRASGLGEGLWSRD